MVLTTRQTETLPMKASLAECHGSAVQDLHRDLWELFQDSAVAYPQHAALLSLWQDDPTAFKDEAKAGDTRGSTSPPTPTTEWTYEHLLQKTHKLASCLQAAGCGPGDRLAVFMWNSVEWALFFWASAKLGLVFVPLDPRLPAQDIRELLESVAPTIVVAQDNDVEQNLQKAAPAVLTATPIRISCSSGPSESWTQLTAMVDQQRVHTESTSSMNGFNRINNSSSTAEKHALIISTSGTTSSPRGCMHTAANLWSQTTRFDPNPDGQHDRWLVHTPVSHIFAINNVLRAWRYGDTVVFPSKTFEVKATMRALVEQKCTRMSAIPAVLKGLLAHDEFPGSEALNLSYVTMGSTMITKADIDLARHDLGSTSAIQAFGMSEGAPITSWQRSDPLLEDGYHAGVGKALPGCNIRICSPGTQKVLARNEVGELHIGGTSVIEGYLQGVETDKFYHDNVSSWLLTGDQGFIDDDGVLHINGRYKDIIIRGGENIAPIKIEAAIEALPGVTAQVVGLPDRTAGQIAIAIVSLPETISKEKVAEKAAELGDLYRLDGIYSLQDLGLKAFPRTLTGKIRKDVLKEVTLKYRAKMFGTQEVSLIGFQPSFPQLHKAAPATSRPNDDGSRLIEVLCSIWEELIGLRPGPHMDLRHLTDSITALRYCNKVLTELGCRLFLQDLAEKPTIAGQAAIIKRRGFTMSSIRVAQANSTSRSPPIAPTLGFQSSVDETSLPSLLRETSGHDMIHLPAFRQGALLALSHLSLKVEDIQDLYPIKDCFRPLVLGPRPQSYRHRFCFEVVADASVNMRDIIETALTPRCILRTILGKTSNGTPFHVSMKPSRILFDRMIKEVAVPDEATCQEFMEDDSAQAFDPVLMTEIKILKVVATGRAIVVFTHNHSVFDILSLNSFHNDIDRLLTTPDLDITSLGSPTPFKLFSDLLYLYQDSIPAKESVENTAQNLRGISKFRNALWPSQRAPGWMIRRDRHSHVALETNKAASRIAANEHTDNKINRTVSLPDMERLRVERGIEPQLLAIAALAVFNVLQTGEKYAIFNTVDAGRSWPFVPPWLEHILPPVMGVDGPTVEWVLNMCSVDMRRTNPLRKSTNPSHPSRKDPETIGEMLLRMRHEQERKSKDCHAPWSRVMEALGPDEAAAAIDASCRQTFVWDITLRTLPDSAGMHQALKRVGRSDWADCGFYWKCCMLDKEHLIFEASWDTAQLGTAEVEAHCTEFSSIIQQLAKFEHWNMCVGDVFGM